MLRLGGRGFDIGSICGRHFQVCRTKSAAPQVGADTNGADESPSFGKKRRSRAGARRELTGPPAAERLPLLRIKLRHEPKELLPHLAEMSGNEVKLYLLLQFKADMQEGPAGFDEMARWCGWSLSTLKRAIRELKAKEYISQVKSDLTATAVVSAEVKPDPNPKTVEVKSDPSKVYVVKSDPHSQAPGVKSDLETIPDFPSEQQKSKPLELLPGKYLFSCELPAVAREALSYVGFQVEGSLSRGFVVLLEKFGKLRPWPRPGMLASNLIERALHWQNKRKTEAKDPRLYAWPPGFQKHRDRLRVAERVAGRQERERVRAAA